MIRSEITSLAVGTMLAHTLDLDGFTGKAKPNARYGNPRAITNIVKKFDVVAGIHADKLCCLFYTEHGNNGGTISGSIIEGQDDYIIVA